MPRVLHCWSDGKGGQKIDNTGPLTKATSMRKRNRNCRTIPMPRLRAADATPRLGVVSARAHARTCAVLKKIDQQFPDR